MSALVQKQPSPDASLPVRGKGFAQMLVRRMLRHPELRFRLDNPDWMSLSAERVLRAVAELVATDSDALEYRLHPNDAAHGLAARVGEQMNVRRSEATIEQDLDALARAGLIVLTPGGVRLGIDYEPPRPRGAQGGMGAVAPRVYTPRKMAAQQKNSRKAVEARRKGQGTFLLGLQGGRTSEAEGPAVGPTVEPNGSAAPTQAEPTVGFPETQAETQTGTQAEPTVGSPPQQNPAGLRDAPGLSSFPSLAAAAEPEGSINSFACTAAAAAGSTEPAAPKPRANAGGCEAGANTQAGPTEGPKAGPTEGPSEPPTAAPNGTPTGAFGEKPEAGPPDEAVVLKVALELAGVMQVDGQRGEPGLTYVSAWMADGLTREEMLQVTRDRVARNRIKVTKGLAVPVATFNYLDGAMRDEAEKKRKRLAALAGDAARISGSHGGLRDSAGQPLSPASAPAAPPAPAAPQLSREEMERLRAARNRRHNLSEKGKASLQQAIDACRDGDDAALGERIAHLHHWQQSALAVLLDEEPRARALYDRMRRAG